jgi:hypothetical protein
MGVALRGWGARRAIGTGRDVREVIMGAGRWPRIVFVAGSVLCAEAIAGRAAVAQGQRAKARDVEQAAISRELAELYRDDQKDQNDASWDESTDAVFSARQVVRRNRAMEIIEAEQLGPLDDWNHAAMLLQHGTGVDDYLLAHVLSIPPAREGMAFGRFMCAATLDRFLIHSERPQIFGTQSGGADPSTARPIEPFDDSMAPYLRALFDAPAPMAQGAGETKRKHDAPSAKELPKLLKQAAKPATKVDPAAASSEPEWLTRARAIVKTCTLESDEELGMASRILSSSSSAADLLDAHVLAVAALFVAKKPDPRRCAETLDRLLVATGRPQRFGTLTAGGAAPPERALPAFVLERFGLASAKK